MSNGAASTTTSTPPVSSTRIRKSIWLTSASASPQALIKNKLAAGRDKDLVYAQALWSK